MKEDVNGVLKVAREVFRSSQIHADLRHQTFIIEGDDHPYLTPWLRC